MMSAFMNIDQGDKSCGNDAIAVTDGGPTGAAGGIDGPAGLAERFGAVADGAGAPAAGAVAGIDAAGGTGCCTSCAAAGNPQAGATPADIASARIIARSVPRLNLIVDFVRKARVITRVFLSRGSRWFAWPGDRELVGLRA
jgi:hypothetical protein